ncbi:DUF6420 family protein [Streptomyces sp. 372A]
MPYVSEKDLPHFHTYNAVTVGGRYLMPVGGRPAADRQGAGRRLQFSRGQSVARPSSPWFPQIR